MLFGVQKVWKKKTKVLNLDVNIECLIEAGAEKMSRTSPGPSRNKQTLGGKFKFPKSYLFEKNCYE